MNDGVEESPPSKTAGHGSAGPNPHDLFVDLLGANVGFRHWHPMPVSQNGGKLAGQSEMGGVWEWTSSVLDKHEGFEAMSLYPGYTGKGLDVSHAGICADASQPTSSMASIMSCSVDLGLHTHALQDARACMSICPTLIWS